MIQFLVLITDSKQTKKPCPTVMIIFFLIFLVGWKLCEKLDDAANLLHCIIFLPFVINIFKWDMRCEMFIKQNQKDKYYVIPFIELFKVVKFIETK